MSLRDRNKIIKEKDEQIKTLNEQSSAVAIP